MLGYRSQDAVITIFQNNKDHCVLVHDANAPAQKLLGKEESSLEGQPLDDMLPERIRSLLREYVEYDEDGNDVGTVLGRVKSFCMLDAKEQEVSCRLKVLRSTSLNGHAFFKLILQTEQSFSQRDSALSMIHENFKGHEVLDPATGLPDRASFQKDMELLSYYIRKNAFGAALAIVQLDDADALAHAHSEAILPQALQLIADTAKRNLRPDDTIGCLDRTRIGIILMDAQIESVRVVLNRLRWLIASHSLILPDRGKIGLTATIGHLMLNDKTDEKTILDEAITHLESMTQNTSNALIEMEI